MTKIFSVLLLSLFAIKSNAQKDNKLIHAFNNKFTMSIPGDVDTMSTENLRIKYNKKPDGKSIFYSDASVSFSIVISPVADDIEEDDMIKNKEAYTSQFAAKGYKLEENTVKKVNNHNIIVVSFYSDVPGGKVFNRRFYAVVNKKMIMVIFNTATDIEKRKQQIEESINSVTIN